MPIDKALRHHYGPEWRALSKRIRGERAEWRCECTGQCGRRHQRERCSEIDGLIARTFHGKVVLTVAHLDRNPSHHQESNLLAMCQACHNRYDAADRAVHAMSTRARRRAGRVALLPFGSGR